MVLGITILFFLILILPGVKLRRMSDGIINSKINYALRGLFALEIVVGHAYTNTKIVGLFLFEKGMICAVGVFFMLSGYGLIKSFKTKEKYMDNFPIKRLIGIGFPVLETCVVFWFIQIIQYGEDVVNQEWHFSELINWYIIELSILYVVFYICYKFFDLSKAVVNLCVVVFILTLIMFAIGLHECWYVSTLCFVLGIILFDNEKKIIDIIIKKKSCCLLSIGFLFFISIGSLLFDKENRIFVFATRILATLSFCCLLMVIITNLEIGNKVLNFIGKYSVYIYLIHIILLKPLLIIYYNTNIFIYIFCLVGLSILLGVLFDKLNGLIKKKILIGN